jgi:hypothetical protein
MGWSSGLSRAALEKVACMHKTSVDKTVNTIMGFIMHLLTSDIAIPNR